MQYSILQPRKLVLALATLFPAIALAVPGATSPYVTDPQQSYVQDATSKGLENVNMIACVMAALSPDQMVNKGPYKALVDEAKCDSAGSSSASNSTSTAGGTANYTIVTVDSTRASNSAPMLVSAWLHSDNGVINVHASVAEAAGTGKPYGVFRLDYQQGAGMGFINADTNGLSYFSDEDGGGTRVKQLVLNAGSATSGSGSMAFTDQNAVNHTFGFAYNDTLFRRKNTVNNVEKCFSRSIADPGAQFSVWRYGLYDSVSGAQINRNSGFPIKYVNSGTTYWGYMGYWGLWLPGAAMAVIASDDTISKVSYGGGNAATTDYTITKVGGKLSKYTKSTKLLSTMNKVRFNTWLNADPDAGGPLLGNQNYEVYWDDGAGQFKISGVQTCGGSGCFQTAVSPEVAVPNVYWTNNSPWGIWGWSQSAGGNINIQLGNLAPASATNVVAFTQDIVYPSDFAAITAGGGLRCISNCPTVAGDLTSANPFGASQNRWQAATGALVSYSLDPTTGELKDGANAAVVNTAANSSFQQGIRTGHLFRAADLATVDVADGTADGNYQDGSIAALNVYYEWETGSNSQNQFAAAKDGSGAYVQFDAPLKVAYTVPNDPAVYGANNAGVSITLQYGGFGDLNGIPGHCVDMNTNLSTNCGAGNNIRYVPDFAIPADSNNTVTDGSNTYLVKWLNREVRLADKGLGVCNAASPALTVPAPATLPTVAGWQAPSLGTEPAVTAAPRVIHGVVQY